MSAILKMMNEQSQMEQIENARSREGVTILELLIAAMLSSLLVIMAVTMLGGATDTWRESESTADTLGDGRAAMLVLRRDFESRLRDVPVFVDPRVDSIEGLRSNVMAFFLTLPEFSRVDSDDRGDVGLVAYYVAYTPDSDGGASRKLYRAQLSPDEVWSKVSAEGWDPQYTPDPLADEASGRAELVTSNVLQFAVSGLVIVEDGPITPVPETTTGSLIEAAGVDVVLRVLDPLAASRMTSENDWEGETSASDGLFDTDEDTTDDAGVKTFRARLSIEG